MNKGRVVSIDKTGVGFASACDDARMTVIHDWTSVKFDSDCENYITKDDAAGVGGSGDSLPESLLDTGETATGGTGSEEPTVPNEVEHQRRQACSFVISRHEGEPIRARDVQLSEDRSKLHLTFAQGSRQSLRREEIRLVRLDC
ncbi:hypothetical protein [Pyxidicoccus caerfyrddinensis]|uniref:hypothetical protein n=1 Tax=Pyxidicoccus caerfyrddinensis TaxID=2709663 RepID=UPI0013D91709|nr:hypothetical protein [Pyxidicoccus caerfyrddinensis]